MDLSGSMEVFTWLLQDNLTLTAKSHVVDYLVLCCD